ncbi:MAG: amphi-Trp domain-containing protein [Intrasporangiaceae bacterium]|nr:amphi-Trp domain-containing protein [Intrasporangiaceae bacterium]
MVDKQESWIELLMSVGKELGLEVPTPGRPWPPRPPQAQPIAVVETAPAGTRLIESSETLSREELAELLESLAAKVRGGELSLRTGAYAVSFDVPDEVTVDVAAVSEDGDGATDIELGIVVHWQAPTALDQGSQRTG